jgi:hypothetical protein
MSRKVDQPTLRRVAKWLDERAAEIEGRYGEKIAKLPDGARYDGQAELLQHTAEKMSGPLAEAAATLMREAYRLHAEERASNV